MHFAIKAIVFIMIGLMSSVSLLAQKTVLRDHNGRLITDSEFVELRMANYQLVDHTKREVLADGSIELTTAKIFQEDTIAPIFDYNLITGKTLTASELKNKVVVLNLWFIGCQACLAEMPKLNAVSEKFVDNSDVVFIAITYDNAEAVKKFLKKEKFNYQHVANGSHLLIKLPFAGYPKNIVIGRDGKIKYWRSGIKLWDNFESVITAELDRSYE